MPIVPNRLAAYVSAFQMLSDFRPWREGIPDPIPFMDIVFYAHELGFCGAYAIEFAEMVNVCDHEFIANRIKQAKQQMENAKRRK